MSEFTPGPWTLRYYADCHDNGIMGADGSWGWFLEDHGNGENLGTHAADARLIAAAPEMFELLDGLTYGAAGDPDYRDQVNAVLARVKGESADNPAD